MSAHKPHRQYLYLASPGGRYHRMPTKIGISCRPWTRTPTVNPRYEFNPAMEVIQRYETQEDALVIETRWKRRLERYSLEDVDEIFWIKAGELMRLIEEGSAVREISEELVRSQKRSVYIPVDQYYYARIDGPVEEVVTEALDEYQEE